MEDLLASQKKESSPAILPPARPAA